MIPILFDELAEVLRVCTRLRPEECTPFHIRNLWPPNWPIAIAD